MKYKPHNQSLRLALSLLAAGFSPPLHAEELLFTLAPSGNHAELGFVFATAGDVNGDGADDIAISDRSAKVNGFVGSGIVHVVSGTDGTPIWDFTGSPEASQGFGSAIASLDANGDGIVDLAIGAPGHSEGGVFGSGAVFVYSGADGSLLASTSGAPSSQLGVSLTNAGDQNGDGFDDLYVGAPNANSSRGAVRVLSGIDGSLLRSITNTSAVSSYAVTLATLGDVDGDGRPDLAVGAPAFRVSGNPVGRVLLVRSSDGLAATTLVGTKVYNRVGESLAAAPDLNGDGFPDLLVGSYSGGTAQLISGADFSLIKDLSIPTLPAYRQLTVGGCLDFNGDGTTDFLLGSPALATVGGKLVGGVCVVSGADQSRLFELSATQQLTGLGLNLAVLPGIGFAAGEPNLQDPISTGRGFARVWKISSDADGDGIPDNLDLNPNSVMTPTVVLLGMDSAVPNRVDDQGESLADRFAELGDGSVYQNPAHYQVAVIHLCEELLESGMLTESEVEQIHAAVVKGAQALRKATKR